VSRIGNNPIVVPDKVSLSIEGKSVIAKGPLGELTVTIPNDIELKYENNTITFERNSNLKHVRAAHGLARALTFNAVEGVANGFNKVLNIEGVGYKAELRGERLYLALGYSHPILFIPPDGIKFEVKGNQITVSGIDKQLVGQIAAKVRGFRPPEPYKGKGIRYNGEYVRRKAGKTSAK
jgi:large subunit ribosomal protein L6